MFPDCPSTDPTDVFGRNSIHLGQHYAREVTLPNPKHVSLSKFGISVPFSKGVALALHRFSDICSLSVGTKMLGLDTNWPVTGVQYVRLLFCQRIIGVIDFVRSNDGADHVICPHAELTVPLRVGRTFPVPTPISKRIRWRWLTRHPVGKGLGLVHPLWSVHSEKWIAVLSPPLIMSIAPTSGLVGLATPLDGAYASRHGEYAT